MVAAFNASPNVQTLHINNMDANVLIRGLDLLLEQLEDREQQGEDCDALIRASEALRGRLEAIERVLEGIAA